MYEHAKSELSLRMVERFPIRLCGLVVMLLTLAKLAQARNFSCVVR